MWRYAKRGNFRGNSDSVASRSHRREWALLSFHSVCLSVIPRPTAYHDWSITTKFGRQVYTCPRTRVSLFGSLCPILWVPEGKTCKISPISNTYSCHCERNASCHMTCLSICLSVCDTHVLCIKMTECFIEVLLPPDSPVILVFRHRGLLLTSDGFTPIRGTKYKREWESWAIFDQQVSVSR